jgi:hypothetical protein
VHAADLAVARPWAANYQYPGQTGVEEWPDALPVPAGFHGGWPPALVQPPGPVPVPGPASGPLPSGPAPGGSGAWRYLVGLAIVLVVAVAAGVVIYQMSGRQGREPAARSSSGASPSASLPASLPASPPAGASSPAAGDGSSEPQPGAAPSQPPGAPAGDKPTLRQVPARTVVGPSWAAGDATYTMAFNGWPFAFRTAKTWGCIAGSADKFPDAKVWVCVDEQNTNARQKANIVLRTCPTTCTATERTNLDKQWFDEPGKARPVLDDRTSFVETQRNSQGYYTVDLSHFAPDKPGGPLKWQVGVFVQSPPETREVVQKLLNDIVSQAG